MVCLGRPYPLNAVFHKILLGPFLNTLTHLKVLKNQIIKLY